MRRVGLKTLKNKLSEYVRAAAAGETVLVTDCDRVVAELVPPRAEGAGDRADERFAAAVRAGWITPARLPRAGVPPAAPTMPFGVLLHDLGKDRADR